MTKPAKLARRDGRSASFDAAAAQTRTKSGPLYAVIMGRLMEHGPMTDEQLLREVAAFSNLAVTPSGVRSRRNELVAAGWVTEQRDEHGAPAKKRGASGSPCTLWRAVKPGEHHEPPAPIKRSQSAAQGPLLGDESTPEHQAGLRAALRTAAWHIGDRESARLILEAYLDPDGANASLDEDDAPRISDEEMRL